MIRSGANWRSSYAGSRFGYVDLIGIQDGQDILMMFDFFMLDLAGCLEFLLGVFFAAQANIDHP